MTKRRRRTRPAARGGGPPLQRPRAARPTPRRPGGFTLVELLVVMVIISILLGFILNAAMDSVKRAEERATQSLITKLEAGLNDRLDALLQSRPDPNIAHHQLAAVYNHNYYPNANDTTGNNGAIPGYLRAQVIAWYDYLKSEMPDTFYVQNASPSTTGGVWPLNFAGMPYPYTSKPTYANYYLPMGTSFTAQIGVETVTGIYGASFPAAAGIYKNLGYLPQGYDGIDNNGDSFIDDSKEGIGNDPLVPSPDNPNIQMHLSALIQRRLGSHKHITARSEMLYAILVEGRGPLGSVFNRDEFTDKEVQDTDGDGLPEFVDAWGNPLQFFRWPLLYHSDIQRGQVIQSTGGSSWALAPPYLTIYDQREQNPLDLNQQLMAPMWWSNGTTENNSANAVFSGYPNPVVPTVKGVGGASAAVQAFEFYFHRLTEPYPDPPPAGTSFTAATNYWDRGSSFDARRAFYSKFLVVSGGLDGQLGVFIYSDATLAGLGLTNIPRALIANENNALPFSVPEFADFTKHATYVNGITIDPTTMPLSSDLLLSAQDDISNQNIQTTIAIGGGG